MVLLRNTMLIRLRIGNEHQDADADENMGEDYQRDDDEDKGDKDDYDVGNIE